MVAGMARRRAGPRAGCALLLLPALARADCSWTHESSGASWDLTALQAADHYQFRGMVGAQDSLHATTITAYEDYTYFLNLCKCGRPAREAMVSDPHLLQMKSGLGSAHPSPKLSRKSFFFR